MIVLGTGGATARFIEYLKLHFVKKIPIGARQTYSDAHGLMIGSIVNDAPSVILRIVHGYLAGEKQKGRLCYCNRFSPVFVKTVDLGVVRSNIKVDHQQPKLSLHSNNVNRIG